MQTVPSHLRPGRPAGVAMRRRGRAARSLGGWVVLAAAVVSAAACGSSGSTSASGGTAASTSAAASASATASQASAQVCADVTALHTAVDKVLAYRPGKETIATLKYDVAQVQDKLTALRASAHDVLSVQRGALQTAVNNLQQEVTSSVGTGQAAGIARDLGVVATRAKSLFTAADAVCPSSGS